MSAWDNLTIDFTDHTTGSVDLPAALRDTITLTLQRALSEEQQKQPRSVTVAVVSAPAIRAVNKKWRGKDKVTDVISVESDSGENEFLGEILLCYDFIRNSAKIDGVSFLRELSFVLSHGILHLLGQKHSEEMFGVQDDVSEEIVKHHKEEDL